MFIRVKVLASQPKTELRDTLSDGTLKIALRAPRQRGRANQELVVFLAEYFDVVKEQVRIVSGHTHEIKLIEIEKI